MAEPMTVGRITQLPENRRPVVDVPHPNTVKALPDKSGFVERHGFWWPAGSEDYCIRYVNHREDMQKTLRHCKGRSVAVQAGGHCGVWPLWLAQHFGTVYTFEPDAANFACLSRNVSANGASERIFAARGMLADDGRGPLSISTSKKNIGGHKGKQEAGAIPTFQIDGLNLPVCNLIVLDVEGMELAALNGAAETIDRCKPVLMLEDNELGERYGWGGRESVAFFLQLHEYDIVDRVSHDIVCVSRSG